MSICWINALLRQAIATSASRCSREGQHNLLLARTRVLLSSRVHPGRTASWYLRPIPTYMQVVLCTYYIMKIQYELVVLEINSLDNMYMSHAKYARSAALLHAVHARLPPKLRGRTNYGTLTTTARSSSSLPEFCASLRHLQ